MSIALDVMVREALQADLPSLKLIYNQGIEDRIATLEVTPKNDAEMVRWYHDHNERYVILVAREGDDVVGWVSLNSYSHRCAYDGVADVSIYVRRDKRGTGIGSRLFRAIQREAARNRFHKLVLFAFPANEAGHALYLKAGFRDVGIFREQGVLDGEYVDVLAMEKLIKPFVLFVCKHNAGRSQMAEAYLRRFAENCVDVASAGTAIADAPDPAVVAAMAEDGIDISSAQPKVLDPTLAQRASKVITMGCDVLACDLLAVPNIDEDWGLPDPSGQPIEAVREIRNVVKAKATALAADLLSAPR